MRRLRVREVYGICIICGRAMTNSGCLVLASMQTQRGTPGRVLTSGLSRELCLIPAGELRVVMFKFSLFIEIVDVRCYVSGVQHRDSPFLKG